MLAPCFIEAELWLIEVLHCCNTYFRPFLLLWPWPWPDNLHIRTWPYSLEIYPMCANEQRQVFRELQFAKCVHLATSGHFCPRDKDCGYTIRSVIAKNPMIRANLMTIFYRTGVWAIEVLHCGNRHRLFAAVNLDLDRMPFIYKLDPYYLEIHRMCKYELPTSRLSKVIIYIRTEKVQYKIWNDLTKAILMRSLISSHCRDLRTAMMWGNSKREQENSECFKVCLFRT